MAVFEDEGRHADRVEPLADLLAFVVRRPGRRIRRPGRRPPPRRWPSPPSGSQMVSVGLSAGLSPFAPGAPSGQSSSVFGSAADAMPPTSSMHGRRTASRTIAAAARAYRQHGRSPGAGRIGETENSSVTVAAARVKQHSCATAVSAVMMGQGRTRTSHEPGRPWHTISMLRSERIRMTRYEHARTCANDTRHSWTVGVTSARRTHYGLRAVRRSITPSSTKRPRCCCKFTTCFGASRCCWPCR